MKFMFVAEAECLHSEKYADKERTWKSKIPTSKSLEQRNFQAFKLRNSLKTPQA